MLQFLQLFFVSLFSFVVALASFIFMLGAGRITRQIAFGISLLFGGMTFVYAAHANEILHSAVVVHSSSSIFAGDILSFTVHVLFWGGIGIVLCLLLSAFQWTRARLIN